MDLSTPFPAALADRYRIERELGRGGMGVVYLAQDLKHGRKVVIKTLLDETVAAIGRDRFVREIEIAARLTHPHIVPIHDSGTAGDRLYYVMPYIEGGSLRDRLRHERQLAVEVALRLAREVASALGHAHREGLVHRDIKPENVLLADGLALVADFGLARMVAAADGAGLTTAGTIMGTPAYMAPEQAMGSKNLDARTDLYALGCVLYEMLAGQPPFTGPVETLLHQHVSVEPRPVTDLRPSVPRGVVAVLNRALAKLPADRYPTAVHFAEALASAATPLTAPASEPGAVPHNLPTLRTGFVGRERDLAEAARLLQNRRLLTFTGIGGCGKTRLALELARRQLNAHPDGAWFVDLAPVQDEERVVLAAATAAGVTEAAGVPLRERLLAHFAPRRALVVLDNCEHVLGAAAELAEALLAGCPQLQLVVTSREGLGIGGEQILAVQSLAVPAADTTDVRAIAASESVRLFVDLARLADPGFALNAANAPVVAEICRRLDGIPLALELAAARVKMLSVEEIHARLGDRFRLLTGSERAALARHQTLHATIAWSHDHLSPREQELFRTLAVFVAGWTLAAAVGVLGEQADEFEVLELLTRLVDKSLIGVERGALGETRYSMFETVRQYAQERLDESGAGSEARDRHLAFFLALTEEARQRFEGPDQAAWLARFDREQENVLLALAWCEHSAEGARAGLRMVSAMQLYWVARGQLELGFRATVDAVRRPAAGARDLPRVMALFTAGQLGFLVGRFDEAHGWLEEALAIARELDDSLRIASILRAQGLISQGRGDRAAARRALEESMALSRRLGNPRELSIGLNALAEIERVEGRLDAAEPLYREFLAVAREMGNLGATATALLNLAMVAIGRGDRGRGRTLLIEALSIADDIGSKRLGQMVMETAAGLAASAQDWAPAARLYGAADARREQMGLHRDTADEAFVAPLMARAREAMGTEAFAHSEAAGRALSHENATSELKKLLGRND